MNTIHQAVHQAFSEIAGRHPSLVLPSTITDVAIHEFTQALFENREGDPVTQEDADTLASLKEKIAQLEKERLKRGEAGPAINQVQRDVDDMVRRLETFLRSPQLNIPTEPSNRSAPSSLDDTEVGSTYNELPDEMRETVLDRILVRDLGKYALVNRQARTQVNEKLTSVLQLVAESFENELVPQDKKSGETPVVGVDLQDLQAILAIEEPLEKKGSATRAFLKQIFDVIPFPKAITVRELPELILSIYKRAHKHDMSLASYLAALQEIKEKGDKASTFNLLTDDKVAMEFAIKKDYSTLKLVSPELKTDLDLITSAIAQSPEAYYIVDGSLRGDEKVLRAMSKHGLKSAGYVPPGPLREKIMRWVTEERKNDHSSQ